MSTMNALCRGGWKVAMAALLYSLGCASVTAGEWVYTARQGDNLWNLAEEYLTGMSHWREFRRLNDVRNPRAMQPGTKIRFPEEWLRVEPLSITVIAVSGTVTVSRQGVDPVPVTTGITLRRGDVLRSASNSSTIVQLPDGSRILVRPRSRLAVGNSGNYGRGQRLDSRLQLQSGRVESTVAPDGKTGNRLEIKTPSASAVVRGTRFRVSSESGSPVSRAEVIRGAVAVKAAGVTRLVEAGNGVVVQPGDVPSTPRPLLAAPDLSGIGEHFERVQSRIRWPALAGARAYQVQLATGARLSTLLLDRRVDQPLVSLPRLADGQYVLKVRAIDDGGLEGLGSGARFTLNAHPEPPFAISPRPDETVRNLRPGLRWSTPGNAVAFRLQLARDEDFQELVLKPDGLVDPRLDMDQDLEPGAYYWRIATRGEDGEVGPFSPAMAFVVRPPPSAPLAEAHADQESVLLTWAEGESGQSYELMLADDQGMSRNVRTRTTSQTQFALPPTSEPVWFRLRTIDPDGYAGPWGAANLVEPPGEPEDLRWLLLFGLPLLLAL